MPRIARTNLLVVATVVVVCAASAHGFQSQSRDQRGSLPNSYRTIANWAHLPPGRTFGQTTAIGVDARDHVWIADRCGGSDCTGRTEDPIMEFDPSGRLLRSFGRGLFAYPHGMDVDQAGNVWVTDAVGEAVHPNGIGQQVFKFSPTGKILLTLGKPGVAGDGSDTFNQPSDVLVAPNGDIFVADGHAPGDFNARIVKFSKDGTFIKSFGRKGSAAGELISPHALAMDSRRRLFVADRENNRIQIFDQDGHSLATWKQFGRPSGIYIDKHDVLYVADSESIDREMVWTGAWAFVPKGYGYNPGGFKRGIHIGSARDGSLTAFIPDPYSAATAPGDPTSGAEGVAADSTGAIYGAEVREQDVKKYIRVSAPRSN